MKNVFKRYALKRVEQVSRFISSIYIVKKNGWIWVWATYTTREFIAQLDQIPRVRMPFSSQEGYKFKLYNQEYQYNEVKKNFKDL